MICCRIGRRRLPGAQAALLAAALLTALSTTAEAQDEAAPADENAVEEALDPAVAAAAADQGAKDRLLVGECLETLSARGAPARVCIDIVTRACVSEPGGETTAGAVACEVRERDAWMALLAEATEALDAGMSNTERERFAAARDAWAGFRDAQCAYEAAMFEDGSLQGLEQTACERRLTAERTIALHDRAADMAERR